jgi:hypothetical protein
LNNLKKVRDGCARAGAESAKRGWCQVSHGAMKVPHETDVDQGASDYSGRRVVLSEPREQIRNCVGANPDDGIAGTDFLLCHSFRIRGELLGRVLKVFDPRIQRATGVARL